MTFHTLGLSEPLLTAVSEQKYTEPTPIQLEAIPAVLSGKDVMAAAQTGTGKTASFTLPVLDLLMKGPRVQPNQARALILTPTRELAAQIDDSVKAYGKHVDLRSTVVFGGVKINPQMMRLRRGVDILVATPGRLLDLYNQNAIRFKQLEMLVLDEADRMLDMGFINDIRKIISLLPPKRQNLLFSATFSKDIRNLAKSIVKQPIEISVTPPNTTAQTVKQTICLSDKTSKPALLAHLIDKHRWMQVLVFTRTKHGANRLSQYLEKSNIDAAAIHGNKSQGARTRALTEFKNGKIQVLVATDIAARGLDIEQLPQVVNFELPNVPEDYIHRIGRTGRAGENGQAISLVCSEESKYLRDIERLIKTDFKREIVEGFEPTEDFSNPNKKPAAKTSSRGRGGQRAKHAGQSRSGQAPRKPGAFKGKRKPTSRKSRHTANV